VLAGIALLSWFPGVHARETVIMAVDGRVIFVSGRAVLLLCCVELCPLRVSLTLPTCMISLMIIRSDQYAHNSSLSGLTCVEWSIVYVCQSLSGLLTCSRLHQVYVVSLVTRRNIAARPAVRWTNNLLN